MPKLKKVFIAHPIRGDVPDNLRRVCEICRALHTADVMPVVPYLATLAYFKDGNPKERELGIDAGLEYIRSGFVDELWLYGDSITDGMWREIFAAFDACVPVVPKTEGTKKALTEANLCTCGSSSMCRC